MKHNQHFVEKGGLTHINLKMDNFCNNDRTFEKRASDLKRIHARYTWQLPASPLQGAVAVGFKHTQLLGEETEVESHDEPTL